MKTKSEIGHENTCHAVCRIPPTGGHIKRPAGQKIFQYHSFIIAGALRLFNKRNLPLRSPLDDFSVSSEVILLLTVKSP
jgi:hypothetical protein